MNSRLIKILKNPIVISLLLAILILWGLIYGTLVWLDIYTRHNEAVVIPDVKGMTLEEAAPFLFSLKMLIRELLLKSYRRRARK